MNGHGRTWIALGAWFAAIGVAAGALGAHALEQRLDPERLADWETAVRYLLLHALALVGYGLWLDVGQRTLRAEGVLFLVGTACFSGSIALLVFGLGSSWVWPLTPLGGTLLLVGWILWGVRAWLGR